MYNDYLRELIRELKTREGGLVLNMAGQSEAVVLTMDRYNELLKQLNQLQTNPDKKNNGVVGRTILVTGGAGYIGSHVVRLLTQAGHHPVVIDDMSAGKEENLSSETPLYKGDCGDAQLLSKIFREHPIDAVVHLAASVEVEESVAFPEKYLQNNALTTAKLLAAMDSAGIKTILFSSTSAVYGDQKVVPVPETAIPDPVSPYGYSKLLAEHLIRYYCQSRGFRAVVFRYFNACGSDFDRTIYSKHDTHLITVVSEVIAGNRSHVTVFGNDYPTFDGTCIRDYVHVLDIARAHVYALNKIADLESFNLYNIGTSKGLSVEQVIQGAAEISNRMVPIEMGERRAGDPAVTLADNRKIKEELDFEPIHSDLETIIKTSLKFLKP